jgi:hypothetical protein
MYCFARVKHVTNKYPYMFSFKAKHRVSVIDFDVSFSEIIGR